MEGYIQVGVFKKPHALQGAVKAFLEDGYEVDLVKATVLFIDQNGKAFPYFLESVLLDDLVIINLEDVDTPEAARHLNGKKIYLRSSDVSSVVQEEEDYVGFKIIDEEVGEIGVIDEVLEYPEQLMGVVNYKEKETLIPLIKAFIQKIDKQNQILFLTLPQGLLEL